METWQQIPNHPFYEVSTEGRVRRMMPSRGAVAGRVIAQRSINSGYLTVTLNARQVVSSCLVHRLIAEAFLGPCPEGYEVNHKDADKKNNRPANLEYMTRSENLIHSGSYRGERNSQARLTEASVVEIRRLYATGIGYKNLGRQLGLPWGIIRNVIKRRTWKHV
jgi:hypothetical protein